MRHKANHLAGETSPYLLQHAHNPVNWYPWGKEAIERAKKEKKPIFLSIGYSACHWCHVMERESFENEAIAALMNQWFVCIKVDREERPDVDEIYMAAVTRMNHGNGGWPMSVFLTPDLKPFLGGTYYPPKRRGQMPGFDELLRYAHKIYTEQPDKVAQAAQAVVASIEAEARVAAAKELPGDAVLKKGVEVAAQRFDAEFGGFGWGRFAPKFPHSTELTYLLRYGKRKGNEKALEMARSTLTHMARGGMYDQIGGGFHRYSVDRQWLVPHFEKMLYDNSQLASLYLEAWQATSDPLFKRVATECLDYVLREMTAKDGAFWSTTDADSEGEEGKFFVWSKEEFVAPLGENGERIAEYFGVTDAGNFEGHNIPTRRRRLAEFALERKLDVKNFAQAVEDARKTLYAIRDKRVHPALDDKILSAWNGLMLSAFAQGAAVLDDARYLAAARKNANFLLTKMRQPNGRLWRTRRGDKAHLEAYLVDYAAVTRGLLDLYTADPNPRWIRAARELHSIVELHFADAKHGGYFAVIDDHEELIVRRSSAQESSVPSDVGMAACNAAQLGLLAGEPSLLERARGVLKRHGNELERFPNGYGQLLLLLDFLEAEPKEIYIAAAADSEPAARYAKQVRRQWPPYRVLAWVTPKTMGELKLLLPGAEGKTPLEGKPAVYVCTEGVCKAPKVIE